VLEQRVDALVRVKIVRHMHTTESRPRREHTRARVPSPQFYCSQGDLNDTVGFGYRKTARSGASDIQMTFDGVERFLDGTFCRVYFVHEATTDPYADNNKSKMVLPYFETIGDNT
jgi:hypothetical protein